MLKRFIAFIGVLILIIVPLVVSLTGAAAADDADDAGGGTYPLKIIVGYMNGATSVVDVPRGMSTETLIQEYMTRPYVSYAEADQPPQ
jgi:hypothetical protein